MDKFNKVATTVNATRGLHEMEQQVRDVKNSNLTDEEKNKALKSHRFQKVFNKLCGFGKNVAVCVEPDYIFLFFEPGILPFRKAAYLTVKLIVICIEIGIKPCDISVSISVFKSELFKELRRCSEGHYTTHLVYHSRLYSRVKSFEYSLAPLR